ncbi:MAG TPA: AIR synthase related protein, partial [Bacteroidota bacterium]|nr:AIR synthase related protein [Bacteroidota bacterium]
TKKALAVKTDCNGRYVYLNPRRGAQIAVAESARNVSCTGAVPVAITNCLNFGNPYDPEVYWQFSEAIAGMREACVALETPVTGGNVSFYNESPDASVLPTPVIGMLGVHEDADLATASVFRHPDDQIVLLGVERGELGGSEYLFQRTGSIVGDAPLMDLDLEKKLQAFCRELGSERLIESAHDCSEGGLAVSVAECLFGLGCNLGATVTCPEPGLSRDRSLFGETQSRMLVSVKPENLERVIEKAGKRGIPAVPIGKVDSSGKLRVDGVIEISVSELELAYEAAIPKAMGEK